MTIAASFTPKPAILSFAITHELLTMRLFLDSLANNNFRMKYSANEQGFYGNYGGAYIPEILYKTVEDLKKAYLPIIESEEFKKEYHALLRDYV